MHAKVLPDFRNRRIMVLGDIMLDRYLMGEVNRISPEAPVPVLRVKERFEMPGGAGNVCNNLVSLGCSTVLIGVVGEDSEGERLAELCARKGIEGQLVKDRLRPTITKTRIIAMHQQLLRLDEEESRILLDSTRTELLTKFAECLSSCQAVILSDYGKGILQTPDLCQTLISMANEKGVPVLVDPKGKQWERYRRATCITPNAAELEATAESTIASELQLSNEAGRIRKLHETEWLLVTRGSMGMCLFGPQDEHHCIPTVARQVYDVSGAGDTVIATLTACVASGIAFLEAARMANTAAGIVIGKLGTQPVTAAELETALILEASGNGSVHDGKFRSADAAQIQVLAWRSNGEKIIFTNGCFDLLHPGHIHLLHQARSLGDRLVIGLNSDSSVRRLKGPGRPILPESDRAILLGALSCVDMVVSFDEDTPLALIESLKPDVIVKGSDYTIDQVVGREKVEGYGGRVELISVLAGHSTTNISKTIQRNAIITQEEETAGIEGLRD
ncbi:Bifunctional protein HldE (Includes: D-beta-D-heptose 7-phosphate kinase; D-beta-D-heptose 1-phosphate adenylyltransferase) [Syntrophobacter sp. SbD1]|nr:Bifunctional protein HldE (Includes: D-beta-D-heptose 7-phosphate kinase; D-beta-D-heptose 1-phosphate adenylyltransferase) [Syntrophobacter sp. SbD1]